MTTLFQDGMVLTPERLASEIARQVGEAVAEIVPPTPVAGTTSVLRQQRSVSRWTARFGYAVALTSGEVSDAQTWHHTRTIETPTAWVRFVWPYDQFAVCTIAGALVAPSASVVDPINPVDGVGAAVSWIPVTFNNAGLPLTLAEQLDAEDEQVGADVTTQVLFQPPVNGVTWPDGPRLKSQSYTYSDWIRIVPLARTDVVGGKPVIMDRVKFTGPISLSEQVSTADHGALGGRQFKAYANAGDCVTTPASFTSTTLTNGATPMIEYITAHPVVSLAVAGDSTQTPTVNHVSLTALALSTAVFPVEFQAWATGGFDAEAYCGNLRRALPALRPSVVFIEARSANGITSVPDAESDWQVALQLVDAVQAYGGTPVLMTPLPCPGRITTAEQEASRLAIKARILAAETAGVAVLDLDAYFSDGATPIANFRPGLSDDGVHPSAAAQTLCATELTTPFTRDLLGL